MSELLVQPKTTETSHDPVDQGATGGNEFIKHPRTVNVGAIECKTNIPEGVDIFSEDDSSLPAERASLKPAELDKLPPAEYFVSYEAEDFDDPSVTREIKRKITLRNSDNGKVVSADSFRPGNDLWTVQPDTERLMEVLGYTVDKANPSSEGYTITGVPTPETVKTAVGKVGVEIDFYQGDGYYIPGDRYLAAYAEGKYPVSIYDEKSYKHDIEDDHLTAMVLGGEPLKEALKGVAKEALGGDKETIDHTAQYIDSFTATLRAVIAPHGELLGEAYGENKGRETLIEAGAEIGLTKEEVEEILTTGQATAERLSIQFTNLK